MWGHVTQFWNFGTPLISDERLKLETSNFARIQTAVSSNEENAKFGQKATCGGQETQFWNLARIRTAVSFNEENAKLCHKGSCGGHVTQFWN